MWYLTPAHFVPRSLTALERCGSDRSEQRLLGHSGGKQAFVQSLCAWSAGGVCSMTLGFGVQLGGWPLRWMPSDLVGLCPGGQQSSSGTPQRCLLPDLGHLAWSWPSQLGVCLQLRHLTQTCLNLPVLEGSSGRAQRHRVRYNPLRSLHACFSDSRFVCALRRPVQPACDARYQADPPCLPQQGPASSLRKDTLQRKLKQKDAKHPG